MLNTKSAMELVDELTKPKEETPAPETEAKVTETVEEPKGTAEETGTSEVATPKEEPGAAEETKADQPSPKEEPSDKKPHFSSQKQIDFAFQKEKAKRKALQAKYDAVSKELEILKARNPQPEQFQNQADHVNYLVDVKTRERDLERLQESIQESQYQEYNELNNARIADCFPEEDEQRKFRAIISTEGPKLLKRLDEADPEQSVLAFLDDSDISPLLTRLLIAEPAYLDNVLSKRSPYGKYQAMSELAQKVEYARRELANKRSQDQAPKSEQQVKKPMPIVGSVTKSIATKDSKAVFDPNEYLAKMKSKNKYYNTK